MSFFKRFRKKQTSKAPHEIFPEVRFWKKGDWINGVVDFFPIGGYFEHVTESGFVYLRNGEQLSKHHIEDFYPGMNKSCQNRRLQNEITTDDGQYMELCENFQKAYEELTHSSKSQA